MLDADVTDSVIGEGCVIQVKCSEFWRHLIRVDLQ